MLQPEENPDVERLMAEARTRAGSKVDARELIVEGTSAVAFLIVAVGMAVLLTPSRSPSVTALAILCASYVAACRVQFDVGAGYAVPTQLFLVPMLFVLPTNVVPLVVSLSWLLGRLNEYVSGDTHPGRLFQVFGDSWHSVGPAVVLILAGAEDPAFHHWPVYLLALASQFGLDLASSTIRAWLALGLRPSFHGRLSHGCTWWTPPSPRSVCWPLSSLPSMRTQCYAWFHCSEFSLCSRRTAAAG